MGRLGAQIPGQAGDDKQGTGMCVIFYPLDGKVSFIAYVNGENYFGGLNYSNYGFPGVNFNNIVVSNNVKEQKDINM
jgi:hypothetical protein